MFFFSFPQGLLEALNSDELLPYGSQFEVEIRGCSIRAVDLMVEAMHEKDPSKKDAVNAILADYFLWGFRREKAEEMTKFPYHKTRSIYY